MNTTGNATDRLAPLLQSGGACLLGSDTCLLGLPVWLWLLVGLGAWILLEVSCRRTRGIGACASLALCPGRCTRYTEAIIHLRSNEVELPAPTYTMRKWRPWNPENDRRAFFMGTS